MKKTALFVCILTMLTVACSDSDPESSPNAKAAITITGSGSSAMDGYYYIAQSSTAAANEFVQCANEGTSTTTAMYREDYRYTYGDNDNSDDGAGGSDDNDNDVGDGGSTSPVQRKVTTTTSPANGKTYLKITVEKTDTNDSFSWTGTAVVVDAIYTRAARPLARVLCEHMLENPRSSYKDKEIGIRY